MRLADLSRIVLGLAETAHRWLAALATLEEGHRAKVARYAEEIASTLARAADALVQIEAEPADPAARRALAREFGRIRARMSTGRWRAPELRNMRRIRQVWQLKVKNSPEVYAATGKRFTVVTLGKDTARAIKLAEEIRSKKPDLDREAAEYAACLSDPDLDHEGHYYAVTDVAEKIAEVDEAKAIRFYKRAMGHDVALKVLADHNADVISKRTHDVRLEAIARSGLRYLSDCPDRKRAVALVEELLAKGLSRSTVSLTVRTLNTIWRIAVDRGVVSKSPFERLQVRVPRTLKRALSPQELRAVIAVSNERTAALVKYLALTGLRIGAALAVRQEHVRGDVLTVERDKTGGGRVVVLSGAALEALQVFLAFPRVRYERHHRSIVNAYRDAGVTNADAHSLRRTFAQSALETHCDAVIVAHLMGHSSVKLSRAFGQYATMGPSREQQREVVERVSRHLLGEQQASRD